MNVTEEIKSRLDIIDIVSEHVQLRKSGRNYAGFCPFHSNTRTPAFYVFPETQTWHCFGACAEGGDLYDFVMKKHGWDFREALEYLAQRAGVQLEEPTPAQKRQQAVEERLTDLLTAAADYFHQLLQHAPQAEHARRYVQTRGLAEETLAAFRVGFALDTWDACRTHFNGQGYSDDDLVLAGLLTENEERGTRYDRFRNRLMIPIRDVNGRVVGFGARTLDKEGIPKYLNSPQTHLFDKSSLLFNLDRSKRYIRSEQQAVIVEGYMDVMQAWQSGFRNVVAQMGTALTERQLSQLKRYTRRFVIALDADAAGVKATMRSLQVARETLDREYEVHFDARGLVRHEGRLAAEIHVVTLPAGKDPDNIIRESPDAWVQLVAKAKPIVDYVIDIVTQDLDMNDARAKSAVAQQVMPLIADIGDPVVREHYRQRLARVLRVDERTLRMVRATDKAARPPQPPEFAPQMNGRPPEPGRPAARSQQQSGFAVLPREAYFLRQCLAFPQMIAHVNRKLVMQEEPPLQKTDFSSPADRELLDVLYRRAEQSPFVTMEELCDSLDVVLVERVNVLLGLNVSPESELDRLPDRLVLSVLDWRLAKVRAQLTQLQQVMLSAREQPDAEQSTARLYGQQVHELRLRIKRLNRAKDAMSAVGRRR